MNPFASLNSTVRASVPLATSTTFRIGGTADYVADVATADDVRDVVTAADRASIPWVVIGGGSNLLVDDAGFRGLVIRCRPGAVVCHDDGLVEADAGVSLNAVVRSAIQHGLSGIEGFAGTPGTIGGAVSGNAHWGNRSVGDVVESVEIVRADGSSDIRDAAAMAFAYDTSALQGTHDIVVRARLRLTPGASPDDLRAVARQSIERRRQSQPLKMPSAGCVFQNPVAGRDTVPEGVPWSAGALIDRAGLKGAREGGAQVSPVHANFIVNTGDATASAVRALIARCREAVLREFGVALREELVHLDADGMRWGR
jgi:UDP-N-acetylmuramate dehydrogenase